MAFDATPLIQAIQFNRQMDERRTERNVGMVVQAGQLFQRNKQLALEKDRLDLAKSADERAKTAAERAAQQHLWDKEDRPLTRRAKELKLKAEEAAVDAIPVKQQIELTRLQVVKLGLEKERADNFRIASGLSAVSWSNGFDATKAPTIELGADEIFTPFYN